MQPPTTVLIIHPLFLNMPPKAVPKRKSTVLITKLDEADSKKVKTDTIASLDEADLKESLHSPFDASLLSILKPHYYEPKKKSDATVVFDGWVFHIHTVLLMIQSPHFDTAFRSLEIEGKSEVLIPEQTNFIGEKVGASSMRILFDIMYSLRKFSETDHRTNYFFDLVYLAHYFNLSALNNEMMEIVKTHEIPNSLYWAHVLNASVCPGWSEVRDSITQSTYQSRQVTKFMLIPGEFEERREEFQGISFVSKKQLLENVVCEKSSMPLKYTETVTKMLDSYIGPTIVTPEQREELCMYMGYAVFRGVFSRKELDLLMSVKPKEEVVETSDIDDERDEDEPTQSDLDFIKPDDESSSWESGDSYNS